MESQYRRVSFIADSYREDSMKTLHIDTLRDRNNTRLDKRSAVLADVTVTANQRRIAAVRGQIADALDQRAQLEDRASTQSQREEYGIEQWHEEFVMLREIPKDEQKQLWTRVPNCQFKRFQEAFSHPHRYIVPRALLSDNESVSFDSLSLKPVLVSLDLLPDELAESLCIADFSGDERNPEARLWKKEDAVPLLKNLWQNTSPLHERNKRILEVTSLPEGALSQEPVGTLLYTREHPANPRQKVVQHFRGGAYDALRKTDHQQHSYEGEIASGARLEERLTRFNKTLDREWRSGTPQDHKDRLRAEAEVIIVDGVSYLEHCVNSYKVDARDSLLRIQDLRIESADGTRKENISAVMSVLVRSVNGLKKRFTEMCPKGGYNEQDSMVLRREIVRSESTLEDFRARVQRGADFILNQFQKDPLYTGVAMNEQEQQAHTDVFTRRLHLGLRPIDLESVHLRPFRQFAEAFRTRTDRISAVVQTRDPQLLQKLFVEMHVIGKFQLVHNRIEQLKSETIHPHRMKLSSMRSIVADLRGIFDEFQVFPDVMVSELTEVYEQMKKELRRLESGFSKYEQKAIPLTEKASLAKQVRTYLDTFDTLRILVEKAA